MAASISDVDAFLRINGANPGPFFEFLDTHPDFATAANLAEVDRAWRDAVAKRHDCSHSAHRARKISTLSVMLKFAIDAGIDTFAEALQSDPPNALCMSFQQAMHAKVAELQRALQG